MWCQRDCAANYPLRRQAVDSQRTISCVSEEQAVMPQVRGPIPAVQAEEVSTVDILSVGVI